MKTTQWAELIANECKVLDKCIGEYTGEVLSIKVKHPALKRSLWFQLSKAGNWYWRNTGRESTVYADGYIIVGELS